MPINNNILNQKGTPAFYSDIFANRPTYGYAGRVFISTDTGAIYEDTGTSWTLIADAGAGTTGTLQQVTTNGNTTTLGVTIQGIDINDGAGTGLYNTGIGTAVLNVNTTGANNTAVGFNSLQNNTTGANNTAIGFQPLYANTTGIGNVAIGNGALGTNTTGQYNTAIGQSGLAAITTGTLNTAIGSASGNAITTGSNNTIIGNYAGTTTLASNIVLSDGAGNVRLFSDANGLIGINQAVGSTIGGQLDIHTSQTYALVLNGLTTSNAYTAFSNASVGQWRIGNTYNAGANTFDIFNLGTSSNALSFNKTTNNATFIANVTASSLIKSGGTSAQILAADGSVITAGTNITISGGTIASSGSGSMAIGGSITSATSGSVLFAGTSGVLAQNNANFFWNNSTIRLGIGTATPAAKLGIIVAASGTNQPAIDISNLNDASFTLSLRTNIVELNAGGTGIMTFSNSAERMRIFASGNIAIGSTTDVSTALLQLSSTTKGFLPPIMTTTQKNAISSPATGLVIFDSTLGKLCVFSTTWQTITSV